MHKRNFIDIDGIDAKILRSIIDHARVLKKKNKPLLTGKTLAQIFEKPSTRTRVSFEVGMKQLGGNVVTLNSTDMQLGRGETVADTARVLSRFVDIIMLRAYSHNTMLELSENADVPVINGLTDHSHPCQIIADIMTFEERKGDIRGKKIAWVGDGNNVLNSWIHAADKFGFTMHIACPAELQPSARGNNVKFCDNPQSCVEDVDCVVTDTWSSMGDKNPEIRRNLLVNYQVDDKLMGLAKKDAIFLHCLPVHRGEEVSAAVIDGPQSAVWDEAENRLHAQKAIMAWCLQG